MANRKKVTFNSFFAGIGGFDLGLENQGFKPVLQCELNVFCRDILRRQWPNVHLESDILSLSPADIPNADIWTGGFPCQDVSVARGSKGRDGLKGKNSGLFFPFAELIKSKKPKVILIENVLGLLSSHNGQDFRVILETLSNAGYSTAWRVMNSRYFGSPQSRPRVFICASKSNPEMAIATLYEKVAGSKPKNQRKGFLTAHECRTTGAKVAETAYCLAATSGRHTGTDWSRTYISYKAAVRRLTPTECERLQGFPVGWTSVNCPKSLTELDIDTKRYQALGNAVAVPVIEWIGERLKTSINLRCKKISNDNLISKYSDFAHSSVRQTKLSQVHLSTFKNGHKLKWQSGGICIGDECWDIKAPEAPSNPIEKKLISLIDSEYPDDRYFISPNAAEGILRRVHSQNRTLFAPMHSALSKMVEKKDVA
jgi:DNA (cytosine-5)-methyltransferase 1